MAKIAAILTDKFEDSEYEKPAEAFRNAGHKVITIGIKPGKKVVGKSEGLEVEIEKGLDTPTNEFDALLIPGGYSPDKLRVHKLAVDWVRKFANSGKPVFTICHGPQLLISADVLKGRRITGYASIIPDIRNAGAEFEDKEVVVDNNLVSSRNPRDIPVFIKACLNELDRYESCA
jgi:protease I